MGLFTELKRRNVFRVGAAYAVLGWVVIQVTDFAVPALRLPEWVPSLVFYLGLIGFPFALFFAWAFELTPEGIKLESDIDRSQSVTHSTGRKVNYATIGLLAVAVAFLVFDKYGLIPAEDTHQTPIEEQVAELTEKSIAVLPFVNLSSDPEQEFFSDGISEELLNVLAQFPDLRVAARTSSFQFKGDNRDISEIAKLLKVAHVLEGSVRKSGSRLRITAQLIDADTGFHLWSKTYDRELEDVFAIQDEISGAIGEAMKAELALQGQDVATLPKVVETKNTLAYESYLKGRHLINQRGNIAISEARRQLEKSVRLDPNFAPAQAQLGIAILLLLNSSTTYGDLSQAEVHRLAPTHIEKALTLEPNLAEGHAAMALLTLHTGDSEAALVHAERAIELNPANTDALNWKNNTLTSLWRHKEALETIALLLQVDPLSVVGQLNTAGNLVYSDEAAARRMADQLLKQNPWAGFSALGDISYFRSGLAEALRFYLSAFNIDPVDRYSNEAIVFVFAVVGLPEEARRISDSILYNAEINSGNYAAALLAAQREMREDPDNWRVRYQLAEALYFTDELEAATRTIEQLKADEPTGHLRQINAYIQLASGLQARGEFEEAALLLDNFSAELDNRNSAYGYRPRQNALRAQVAALSDEPDKALELLDIFLSEELDPLVIGHPVFNKYRHLPAFAAIQAKYDKSVAKHRMEVLDLICNNNPVPNSWQPKAETCAK